MSICSVVVTSKVSSLKNVNGSEKQSDARMFDVIIYDWNIFGNVFRWNIICILWCVKEVQSHPQLWMRSFLLTTPLSHVLARWAFQMRLNRIGYRLRKRIRNTSGSSCLLKINEKLINNTWRTSPLSSMYFSFETYNSPAKIQPASDSKLIWKLRRRIDQ